MNIRMLQKEDLAAYRKVRRRALVEHPEAFGMSAEEFDEIADEAVANNMINELPESGILGAFIDDDLVGTIYVGRHPRQKTRHRGSISAMYVIPELRGQKLGKALLEAGIHHLRNLGDIQHIVLAVTVGNIPARNLYRSMGFSTWGVDPAYLRVGDNYYDIEWMVLYLVSQTN